MPLPGSSPVSSAFPKNRSGRLPASFRERDFSRGRFRDCSYFLMFRPPSLLASRIAPTAVSFPTGQLRRLHPSRTCVVAFARIGYAIGRLQAINRTGTLTPLDSQFCRLLPIPIARSINHDDSIVLTPLNPLNTAIKRGVLVPRWSQRMNWSQCTSVGRRQLNQRCVPDGLTESLFSAIITLDVSPFFGRGFNLRTPKCALIAWGWW